MNAAPCYGAELKGSLPTNAPAVITMPYPAAADDDAPRDAVVDILAGAVCIALNSGAEPPIDPVQALERLVEMGRAGNIAACCAVLEIGDFQDALRRQRRRARRKVAGR